jgi:hypothetical protein
MSVEPHDMQYRRSPTLGVRLPERLQPAVDQITGALEDLNQERGRHVGRLRIYASGVAAIAIIRGVDSDFKPQTQPAGLNALRSFTSSPAHRAAAMTVGQSVDALLALTRRQLVETAINIKNISATMPANELNSAAITAIISQLIKEN